MKHKILLLLVITLVPLLVVAGIVAAATPVGTGFTYQGFLKDGGNPASAAYDFEFRLFDAAESGAQIGSMVAHNDVLVTNGLFVVQLDFGSDAFNGEARWLEIGVRPGSATTTPTVLAPRQALTPAPYSVYASTAYTASTTTYAASAGNADLLDGLHASAFTPIGTSWSLTGNAGTVSTTHFLGTTDAQPLVLRTNNTEQARLDAAGNLGLGISVPTERLTVRGNVQVLNEAVPVARSVISANLSRPQSVFAAGRYAYVASYYNNSLAVFDMSDPDSPVALDSISTNLWSPQSVYVAGRYAYVASSGNNSLAVFDVSDPNNLVALSSTSANLNMPWSVVVAGRYAYVLSFMNDRLVTFDVSDPDNLVALDFDSTNLDRPGSVAIVGNYAYVTSLDKACLAVFDVSDPNAIASKGCFTGAGLSGPIAVTVAGRYAYVTGAWNNSLVVFDISNPSNLVALDAITDNLNWPVSVAVAGRYAFVASEYNDTLAVFDVSDPNNLVALGTTSTNLDGPTSVAVAGRSVYVTGYVNDVLAVFDLNHLEASTADIGSLHAGDLHVGESAFVDKHLNVLGSMDVGQSVMVDGDLSVQGNLYAHACITTVTASTTLVTAQSGVVLVSNAAAATITLPAAVSATGLTFTIKRLTANAVTVASAGGTIDGAATLALAAQYDFITVISDGSNWYITGR